MKVLKDLGHKPWVAVGRAVVIVGYKIFVPVETILRASLSFLVAVPYPDNRSIPYYACKRF